jgi:monofunctional biosynthetic peptidoglycan transglycosylase
MSEDSGFFEHDGIDIDAILNSVAVNLKHRKYELGASTISQQVVKNLFLGSEKKVFRKIKEILITEKLEKRLSKNEILEIYLNMVEFGPDIFGVNAASQHYFGRPPKDINAPEGAFIALMLPSPRRYHYAIFENRNLSPARRKKIRRILGDMLANDFISSRQYQEYSHYNFMKYLNRSVSDLQQN